MTNGTTTNGKTNISTTNIALMTVPELEKHIEAVETRHRAYINALRALKRARQAEEEAGY